MRSEYFILLAFGFIVVVPGLLIALAAGPIGWLLLVIVIAAIMLYHKEHGGRSAGVNCPDCGARNDAGNNACHHCGEAL